MKSRENPGNECSIEGVWDRTTHWTVWRVWLALKIVISIWLSLRKAEAPSGMSLRNALTVEEGHLRKREGEGLGGVHGEWGSKKPRGEKLGTQSVSHRFVDPENWGTNTCECGWPKGWLWIQQSRQGGKEWEGGASRAGFVWLYLVGLPKVLSVNARTSWLKCFFYEGGTMAGSDIHLDSRMVAW